MSEGVINNTLQQWQDTSAYWTKHQDTIRMMFAPLTDALIKHAQIVQGQSVLDVAAGAGEPSLTIAQVVGPSGSVMCTDPIAEMVAAAQQEARSRGLENMQFRQCAAESLPFADDSFDVAVCRLGIMFFPDPVAGVREMLRVIKPGGRLAFAVWHKSELNPYCYCVTNVMSQHVESPPPAPDAPDAFRFAEPGKLAAIVNTAGAIDVDERVIEFDLAAPMTPEEFWDFRSEISETLRAKLKNLSGEKKTQIGVEVLDAVKEFFPGGHMKFPAQMIIVTGVSGR